VNEDWPAGDSWIEVKRMAEDYQGVDDREPAPAPNWITEAIDRASEDRTPLLETKISFDFNELTQALLGAYAGIEKFTQAARSVALMGTGYRRHAIPGKRRSGETRAEHARRRRLYAARLQRDRRRRRAGRAPILRLSAFETLIPYAQVDAHRAGPELTGMEVVLSPMVPDDQVFIVDTDRLDALKFAMPYELEPPNMFDLDRASWRSQLLYGMGDVSLTGRTHRATNYLIQADAPRRGYRPSRVWVDDVEVDVDTWMNEGGADRGQE